MMAIFILWICIWKVVWMQLISFLCFWIFDEVFPYISYSYELPGRGIFIYDLKTYFTLAYVLDNQVGWFNMCLYGLKIAENNPFWCSFLYILISLLVLLLKCPLQYWYDYPFLIYQSRVLLILIMCNYPNSICFWKASKPITYFTI